MSRPWLTTGVVEAPVDASHVGQSVRLAAEGAHAFPVDADA